MNKNLISCDDIIECKSNETFSEAWYKNGVLHKEDGPAVISSWSNEHEYWLNGKLHNLNGPAIYKYGEPIYFINGVEIDYDKYEYEVLKYKINNFLE